MEKSYKGRWEHTSHPAALPAPGRDSPGDACGEHPDEEAGEGCACSAAGGGSGEWMTDSTVALHRDGQDGEHGGVGNGVLYIRNHFAWKRGRLSENRDNGREGC